MTVSLCNTIKMIGNIKRASLPIKTNGHFILDLLLGGGEGLRLRAPPWDDLSREMET